MKRFHASDKSGMGRTIWLKFKNKHYQMKKYFLLILLSLCFLAGCNGCQKSEDEENRNGGKLIQSIVLSIDKACYSPGQIITFTSDKSLDGDYRVRYRHLGEIIDDLPVSGKTWTWKAPDSDFTGYLAEVYSLEDSVEKTIGTIGVDVSSDWKRFPRYGFLSDFSQLKQEEINSVIENLNRHHINGLQFYDWHFDHHKPLAGTEENPASSWLNIASATCYGSTIKTYISEAKNRNMRSMFYNLCYGALKNGAEDGVKEEWYIFEDTKHSKKVTLSLSSPFKSSIYLTDPGNPEWLDYMAKQVGDVYSVYDFDGYHIDQVGIHDKYDYTGKSVNLPEGFAKFINKMKDSYPAKSNVFNAVSAFGQKEIAGAKVDFLYNEIWNESSQYADLKSIIENNATYSDKKMNSVFAAYLNYNIAENKGTFNTPGVLLADAVMFSLGASHLELGEHMLGKEYFPNHNLVMNSLLQTSLVSYYDFLVAYENILRDGGDFNSVTINSTNSSTTIAQWPPQMGKVVSLAKKIGNRQVVHLLNFTDAGHLSWRDMDGTQKEPRLIRSLPVRLATSQVVRKIWVGTPDREGKMYEELNFSTGAGYVSFTLPALKYWSMIVLEY